MRLVMIEAMVTAAAMLACDQTRADPSVQNAEPVRAEQLNFLRPSSLNALDLSLEGAPEVPANGVSVSMTCVIEDGAFARCVPAAETTDILRAFVSTALIRIKTMEVGPTSKSGEAVNGRKTTLSIRINRWNRFDGGDIGFRDGDQVTFDKLPTGTDLATVYPQSAIRVEVEAAVDLACVVTSDLGLDCRKIRVELLSAPEMEERAELIAEFEAAARKVIKLHHVAAKTRSGGSPVGIGLRRRILFKLI